MTRETICILAFSPIARDARVLRQIKYLSRHHDLIVVGQGAVPEEFEGTSGVTWVRAHEHTRSLATVLRLPLLLLSRFGSGLLGAWYWSSPANRATYQAIVHAAPSKLGVIHANDWNTLPIALRLARSHRAKVVLDLHEYAPLEFEERPIWRFFYSRPIKSFLRRNAGRIDAAITVAPMIAERYRTEIGLDPIVVLNVPESDDVPDHHIDPNRLRLIHHGAAQPARGLELAIEAVAAADPRVELDFMLVGDASYIRQLQTQAAAAAPTRIRFHEPVAPSRIVGVIAAYDAGLFLLPPIGYSKAEALPNKLFDFIGAGLAVIVGPTPAMAAFVREHHVGMVTSSFDPTVVANELDQLKTSDIEAMRLASRSARREFNAATEMAKLVGLYARLLP